LEKGLNNKNMEWYRNKSFAFRLLFLLLMNFLFLSCMSQEERKHKELMETFNKGMDYYEKKEYQKAHDCFDKCIKMDSSYVEFYENRGSMRSFLNDPEGEKQDCEKGLSMDSCSQFSLLGLAEYYEKYDNHEKASEYYERMIICDSTDFAAYLNYGISCYEQKDYQKALNQFFKYLQLIKEDPSPYEYIGKIFFLQGDSATGEKFLRKAIEYKEMGHDTIRHIRIYEKIK